MKCPRCNQQIASLSPSGRCPSCGAMVHPARQEAMTLSILTGGFFMSLLAYSFLVWVMEQTDPPKPMLQQDLTYPAVALAAVSLWVLIMIDRGQPARKGVQGIMQGALIVMALAELPVILGLVLYFLSGSLQQFVILLGISVLGFVYLATRIPSYIAMIEKHKAEGR